MKYTRITQLLGRGVSTLLILALMATFAIGQNLVIGTGSTYSGAGSYVVKGNITNSGVAAATTIGGTVTMSSTTAVQTIGTATNGAIDFGTLNINTSFGTPTTTAAVSTAVSTALSVAAGSVFDIGANTLTLSGTSTLNGTGSLTVSNASSTVVYNQTGTSQTALGLTYGGALTLSGTSTKNLSAGASVAGAFSHSGGDLTVDQNLTISYATPSFATIATVGAGKTLTLSGTGAKGITTVTTTNATGTIANTGASGLLTIGTLSDNLGSITGGAGGLTLTNGATNHGTITGGAGAVTFSSTLAQAGGTVTAGAGTIVFGGIVTQTGGSIASSALADALYFNANVANSAGTIDLTSTGSAQFTGSVNATGLNFASGTTVTYNAAAQTVADVNYGNLILKSGTKTWTLGAARTISNNLDVQGSSATTVGGSFNLNVDGSISLASDLTKSANAVVFTNAGSAVTGTGFEIVGSVTRTHAFATSTAYTFNNASMLVTPTAITNLTSFTISSLPSTNPTGYSAGNSVNRKYTSSYAGTGFTATVQLAYLASEFTGTAAKLKDFQNGIAKANKLGGTYARSAANGFSYVSLPGLTNAILNSGQELGLDDRYNSFVSIAIAAWDVGSTWDAGSVPTSTDDVEVAGAFKVTIPTGVTASALSVLITEGTGVTGGLALAGTATLAVGTGGLTNNNTTGGGLVLTAGNGVTITGGDLTNNGTITNAGTITVQ